MNVYYRLLQYTLLNETGETGETGSRSPFIHGRNKHSWSSAKDRASGWTNEDSAQRKGLKRRPQTEAQRNWFFWPVRWSLDSLIGLIL